MAFAHKIDNAVEAVYRLRDLFAKRTRLMKEWANFINKPKTTGKLYRSIRTLQTLESHQLYLQRMVEEEEKIAT